MIDLEALRSRALRELDGTLHLLVRGAELDASERFEEWTGIGVRHLLTVRIGVDAAQLAELSFAESSYDRVLRAFASATSPSRALADLFFEYARPRVASAYRGTGAFSGSDVSSEIRAFVGEYQRIRGVPELLEVELGSDGTLIADVPSELRRGLAGIAAAFETPVRFVYSGRR